MITLIIILFSDSCDCSVAVWKFKYSGKIKIFCIRVKYESFQNYIHFLSWIFGWKVHIFIWYFYMIYKPDELENSTRINIALVHISITVCDNMTWNTYVKIISYPNRNESDVTNTNWKMAYLNFETKKWYCFDSLQVEILHVLSNENLQNIQINRTVH